MSKGIVLSGWCSIIPDKLYNSWVKKGWISRGIVHISCGDDGVYGVKDVLEKAIMDEGTVATTWKLSGSKSETKRLQTQGFKKKRRQAYVTEEQYEAIRKDVHDWYDMVFNEVDIWLNKHGYIDLKQGSFDGGFCAETDGNRDVVKNWGAPLAGPKNKVAQIKEKFGRVTVYFNSLTTKERTQIKRFEKAFRKKYDCETSFV